MPLNPPNPKQAARDAHAIAAMCLYSGAKGMMERAEEARRKGDPQTAHFFRVSQLLSAMSEEHTRKAQAP